MSEWVRAILDIVLIGMVGIGLVQAARLIKHLTGLQQGRVDMEKFVREFSATVFRAEAGIKNLKQAARETGDDLERLVDKAVMVRDELHFIVESADQIAERLTKTASTAVKAEDKTRPAATSAPSVAPVAVTNASPPPSAAAAKPATPTAAPAPQPSSRAEQELLQALQKLS